MGWVKRAPHVDVAELYEGDGLDRDLFAVEAAELIENACAWRDRWNPIPEVTVKDRVAESWAWIFKRWSDVEGAKNPIGMAVRISKLASYAVEVAVVGRTVKMRGKQVRVKGSRDENEFGLVVTDLDGQEWESRLRKLRGSRELQPWQIAVIREELALYGGPAGVFREYGRWAHEYCFDPHFREN